MTKKCQLNINLILGVGKFPCIQIVSSKIIAFDYLPCYDCLFSKKKTCYYLKIHQSWMMTDACISPV